MNTRQGRQSIVWGGLLVLFGAVGLCEAYFDLSTWVWIGVLGVAGLFVLGVYMADRSDRGLLIPGYVFWAIALMVIGIELGILKDPFITLYALTAIAIPFLVVYLRDRQAWWALIPAYVMIAVAFVVTLSDMGLLTGAFVATLILTAIALPFLLVFLRDRTQWWALIPAYVLTAVGLMVGLIEAGILGDLIIPAYVMIAIALPFFVVFTLNRENWWALIPAGILSAIGLGFLIAENLATLVAPVIFIILGVGILIRQIRPSRARGEVEASDPTEGADLL
jgi:hypothetical protein